MSGLVHPRQQLASRGVEHQKGEDEEHHQHHPAHGNHGQKVRTFAALVGMALHALNNRFHIGLDAPSRPGVQPGAGRAQRLRGAPAALAPLIN